MEPKYPENFRKITADILDSSEFIKLKDDLHHGINRHAHSVRVAVVTYRIANFFKAKNINETTRAALLHDFYTDDQFNGESPKARLSIHPALACSNATNYFELNDLQKNIIKSHMFPLKGEKPKYKESWLVTGVDKGVACYEMTRFKMALLFSVWVIFIFNILTVGE